MRLATLALAVAFLRPGSGLAAELPDARLEALRPELNRGLAALRLPGQPAPYYFSLLEAEIRQFEVSARLGEIVDDDATRQRNVQAHVRVGTTLLDQTNFMGGGWGGGGSVRTVPLDDDPAPAAREAWLAADAAYKRAVETYAAKQAALKREARPKRAPDFSPSPPVACGWLVLRARGVE